MTDRELLERIRARDVDAFDALWDRHAPYVNGVCFSFLRSKEESEEVLQEIFLAIWDGRLGYQPDKSSLTSWLFFIAKSRCLDRLKLSHRRLPHGPIPDDLMGRDDSDPELEASASERRKVLRSALDKLPQEQREAVMSCFFRSPTYREAAQELGIPLGTLKSRIRLAMKKLAAALADLESDE